jgi:hypothetical protein
LFAQNPAVHADKWVSRLGKMDFDDPEAAAIDLLERASVAKEMRVQVAENLRLAHARNAARFKAVRTGVYTPKVHQFRTGDYVFLLHDGQVPGGALGITARENLECRGSTFQWCIGSTKSRW